MTLKKAIEILTLMGTPEFDGHTEDILAARKLGIEAMKAIDGIRKYHHLYTAALLPGETDD